MLWPRVSEGQNINEKEYAEAAKLFRTAACVDNRFPYHHSIRIFMIVYIVSKFLVIVYHRIQAAASNKNDY